MCACVVCVCVCVCVYARARATHTAIIERASNNPKSLVSQDEIGEDFYQRDESPQERVECSESGEGARLLTCTSQVKNGLLPRSMSSVGET